MILNLLKIAGRVALAPTMTQTKEGNVSAPMGEVIAHMNKFLNAKYTVEASYRTFSDRIHGPWRDSLVDHWYKHAEDERKSSYDLAMKIVGLGSDPIVSNIQIPPSTANLTGFCQILINQELEAIEAGRKLIELAGSNTGLKVLAENTVLLDSHHLDDLRRLSSQVLE